ncbi:MAG: hypothetical protein U0791_09490 [Gemmataceae bacterium]
MSSRLRFPFIPKPGGSGVLDTAPYLPFDLSSPSATIPVFGLLDSGTTFSVIPYDLGLQLGLDWKSFVHTVVLAGAVKGSVAKFVSLTVSIPPFPPEPQIFAWSPNNSVPVLLGTASFFFNFDVTFCRRHSYFEIQPATP